MKKPPRFELPTGIGRLLALLPAHPGSVLFATALNRALPQSLPDDVRQRLLHRQLRIHVKDARLVLDFQWTGERFAACPCVATPDLTVRASASDFLALAWRQEDPDTLFFSRRLVMLGDPELGLIVKNALDAMELPVLDLRQLHPRQVFARRRRAFGLR